MRFETLHKSLLIALLLACTTASGARAQVLMRRTDFVQVPDCPIEKPYAPEPDRSRTTPAEQSLFFAMDGYFYHRIQFSGSSMPTDLEIIWTPDNPYFPFHESHPWARPWTQKTAHLSIAPGDRQCFFNWFFAPETFPDTSKSARSNRSPS